MSNNRSKSLKDGSALVTDIHDFSKEEFPSPTVKISASGNMAYTRINNSTRLLSMPGFETIWEPAVEDLGHRVLYLSDDGELFCDQYEPEDIISVSRNGTRKILSYGDKINEVISELPFVEHDNLQFSYDGSILYALAEPGGSSFQDFFFDVKSGSIIGSYQWPGTESGFAASREIAFSKDSTNIYWVQGAIIGMSPVNENPFEVPKNIWTGLLSRFNSHKWYKKVKLQVLDGIVLSPCNKYCFSSGRIFVVCDDSGNGRLTDRFIYTVWDAKNGKKVLEKEDSLGQMGFFAEGRILYIWVDEKVWLYDLTSRKPSSLTI